MADRRETLSLHVHSPASFPLRKLMRCPNCERETRFAGRAYVWYDTTWICCECGDAWAGGERCERPFRPRWRAESMAEAEKIWAEAGQYSPAEYLEWLNTELAAGPGGTHG